MAVRIVRLRQINDGNIYEKKDHGLTTSGDLTQTRSSLQRAMELRYTLPDGRRFPLFVLADEDSLPPSPMGAGDPFDDQFRGDNGKLKLGSPDWHAVSAQLCAEREQAAKAAAQSIQNEMQKSIGENITALLQAQAKMSAPKAVAK